MDRRSAEVELRRLVDDYRARCLWFMREDYYPDTPEARERVLSLIEQHGDHAAFERAGEVRRWLSQRSSERSVGS